VVGTPQGIRTRLPVFLRLLRLFFRGYRGALDGFSGTVWKSGRGRSMTYAIEHEKVPFDRSLSDDEWACLQPHVPAPNKRERPRTLGTREIEGAISYVLKSGYPWSLLSMNFPPWETVY